MCDKKQKPKLKPVSFSVTDEKDIELLEWLDTKRVSFAGLVKDLLTKEMNREKEGIEYIAVPEAVEKIETDFNINVDDYDC